MEEAPSCSFQSVSAFTAMLKSEIRGAQKFSEQASPMEVAVGMLPMESVMERLLKLLDHQRLTLLFKLHDRPTCKTLGEENRKSINSNRPL